MNIYITTQGARIIREGRHLLVKKGEDTYHTLFVQKLRQVALMGNIDLTPAALRILMRNGVDTVFLTQDGRYIGRMATPEPKNVMLRKKQFALLDAPAFGAAFCRKIVHGKLVSMMTLLMRIKRTKDNQTAANKAREIKNLLPHVENNDSIDSLRGYEGRGSAIYFSAFRHGFLEDHGFSRRVRRPPTDRVNAVLSLLYTFLFNRVYAAIRLANLDPFPAFLHTPDYGRHSLVMDLMEEFRVILVDTLTLALFNLKVLQKDDFRQETTDTRLLSQKNSTEAQTPDVTSDPYGLSAEPPPTNSFDLPPQRLNDTLEHAMEEEGRDRPAVLLTPDAMKRVIENFERKMAASLYYAPLERKVTYQEAMVGQARQYRKVVEGEIREYQPLILQ